MKRARVVEVTLALAVFAALAGQWAPLRLSFAVAAASARGAVAFFGLLAVDAAAALMCGALVALRVACIVAPLAVWMWRWPRHRYAWLPTLLVVFFPLLGVSIAAMSTPTMWLVFSAVSAFAILAARRPGFGWLALAPLVVCAEPALSHSPLGALVWPQSRLAARCAANAGTRPQGFSADLAGTRWYAVTALDAHTALLTGERASRWLSDATGAWSLGDVSPARGNLWQGCVIGDAIHVAKNHRLFRITRAGAAETALPDPPFNPEYDLVEPACDAAHERVFVSELISGGLREVSLRDGTIRHHALGGGFNLQYMRRSDGTLVGIDTARLTVYDPDAHRVLSSQPAGLGLMGIDVCPSDDAVAVTDMTGRLRLFTRTATGYRLTASTALRAPRRIAFSPDCATLAVTSADDTTLWLLSRALVPLAEHRLGPALRDLAYLGPHTVAVADACTATLLPSP